MSDDLEETMAVARANPRDVERQIAAAYACDRAGCEELAIQFYDAAFRLGPPAQEREDFMIGYGSTLRNVGRVDESVLRLSEVVRDHPDNHAARCFFGLAFSSRGQHHAALAELLEVVVSLHTASSCLSNYRRALAEYRDALQEQM